VYRVGDGDGTARHRMGRARRLAGEGAAPTCQRIVGVGLTRPTARRSRRSLARQVVPAREPNHTLYGL
jgi:hypothetical protein